MGGHSYGIDLAYACSQELYDITHFQLENPDAEACQTVVVGKVGPEFDEQNLINQVSRFFSSDDNDNDSGILLFNWGVHCNDHDVSCMTEILDKLVTLTKLEKLRKVQIMFREHEPQHFGTETGVYKGKSSQQCRAIEKVDDWRNEVAEAFLELNGLKERVKTVSIFKSLLLLYQIHHIGDCTHYCYNPLRFEVTWKGILNAMEEFETLNEDLNR